MTDKSLPVSIQLLIDFLDRHEIRIGAGAAIPALAPFDGKVLTVSGPKAPDMDVFVFDEYGDAVPGNPPLCLYLIGMTFGNLDDADSFDHWVRIEALDPALPETRQAFEQNSRSYKTFQDCYGVIPDEISWLDWQLNAGDAYRLRTLV